MDDLSDIAAYYASSLEHEHGRLNEHQLEHDLTWRYLEAYLPPPPAAVLEVGAATGRYTVPLARRGYRVTAVDLTPSLLAMCRARATAAGLASQVQCVVADARRLPLIARADHDAALIMGPLYHLVEAADRQGALLQAVTRLRGGGLLFSAFISRLGIIGDLMESLPAWIEDEEMVAAILTTGQRPPGAPRGGFRGYFSTVEELESLHESLGLQTLALAAVEPAISAADESYNRLAGERRRRWLDLLYAISQEPSIRGASRHLLYIGRKDAAATTTPPSER